MDSEHETRRRNYRKSGFYQLRRVLRDGPSDGRSALSRALASWKGEIEADLGGDLSAQERSILEVLAGDAALLALADREIARLGSAVIVGRGKHRAFVALVGDRQRVAAALTSRLQALGLTPRARPAPRTLAEVFAAEGIVPRDVEPASDEEPAA